MNRQHYSAEQHSSVYQTVCIFQTNVERKYKGTTLEYNANLMYYKKTCALFTPIQLNNAARTHKIPPEGKVHAIRHKLH